MKSTPTTTMQALRAKLFPELRGVRDGFGEALQELGAEHPNLLVLCGDLTESTRVEQFRDAYPDRFIEMGVAEQNMMGVAAGLESLGKIPVVASYAVFSPGRNWDQLRVSVCYSKRNVKIVGCHAGLSVGPDGATHQALEDIAMVRALPNLTILSPADYWEARHATKAMIEHKGPVYLRLGREKTPVVTEKHASFAIGRWDRLRQGEDVTIVATGPLVAEAVLAAEVLLQRGITVDLLNASTLKPVDERALLGSVTKTRAIVTAEDHQMTGGLFGLVAEVSSQHHPVPIEPVGMPDRFGESGTAEQLYQKYGLTASHIIKAVERVLARKGAT